MDTRWKSIDDRFKKIEERFVDLESRIEKRFEKHEQLMSKKLEEILELIKKGNGSQGLLGQTPVKVNSPEIAKEVTVSATPEDMSPVVHAKKERFMNPRLELLSLSNSDPKEEVGMFMSSCVEVTVQDDQELNGDELEKVEIIGLDMSKTGYVIESGRNFTGVGSRIGSGNSSNTWRAGISSNTLAMSANSKSVVEPGAGKEKELFCFTCVIGRRISDKSLVEEDLVRDVVRQDKTNKLRCLCASWFEWLWFKKGRFTFQIWDPGDLDVTNKIKELCLRVGSILELQSDVWNLLQLTNVEFSDECAYFVAAGALLFDADSSFELFRDNDELRDEYRYDYDDYVNKAVGGEEEWSEIQHEKLGDYVTIDAHILCTPVIADIDNDGGLPLCFLCEGILWVKGDMCKHKEMEVVGLNGWVLQSTEVNCKRFLESLCKSFRFRDADGVVEEYVQKFDGVLLVKLNMTAALERTFLDAEDPFVFSLYHEALREPFDHYTYGQNCNRPLVDFGNFHVGNISLFNEVEEKLKQGRNIVLISNYQTEADPAAITMLFERTHSYFAENLICVIPDPLCKTVSKLNHPKIALGSLDCDKIGVLFLLWSVNYDNANRSANELSFVSMTHHVLCGCLRLKFRTKVWQCWPRWRSKILDFQGVNIQTGEEVAIKLEPLPAKHPQLHYESKLYMFLQGDTRIPHLKWFGVEADYKVMVIDLLGSSLEDLFNYCNRKSTLKIVLIPSDESYDMVIKMLFRQKQSIGALESVDKALKSGCSLSMEVFTQCTRACLDGRKLDKLVAIIEKCKTMDHNKALGPSWNQHNYILDAATREDNSKLAFHALEFMGRWITKVEAAKPFMQLVVDERLVVSALRIASRTYTSNLMDVPWAVLIRSLRHKDQGPQCFIAKVNAHAAFGKLENDVAALRKFESACEDYDEEAREFKLHQTLQFLEDKEVLKRRGLSRTVHQTVGVRGWERPVMRVIRSAQSTTNTGVNTELVAKMQEPRQQEEGF